MKATTRYKISSFIFIIAFTFSNKVFSKSVEEAVAFAFNSNPELQTAYGLYRSAYHQHKSSKGLWYPTIDLRASIGKGDQNTAETRAGIAREDTQPKEYTLSLQQLLFDGFFTSQEIKRTESEMLSEYYGLQASAENKALDAITVYLSVLREDTLAKLAEKNLASHKEIFEQIKMRAESGLGSSSDLSQATGRLARAQANVIAGENNLADIHAQYINIIGEAPKDLVLPVVNQSKIPFSLAETLNQSRRKHPTIAVANADIKATSAQLEAAKSGYYPKVTLEISKNKIDDRGNSTALIEETRADIVMTYNLFRGGQDKHNEHAAAYQIEQAKGIKSQAERDVLEGAKLAWNGMVSLKRQLEFLKIHVEQSYITQQAYKKQFDLGRRTLLDLLDTENELFEARKSFVSAETNYILAKYRVLNSMGRLLDALEINPKEYWGSSNG